MKNIILIVLFINMTLANATAQSRIINFDTGETVMDATSGTYFVDTNNTFTPYLGTWKYQNGNEILIIKLEKVTKYFYTEYGNYKDFIKGNYSYTTNGGSSYITNTIITNLHNSNPNTNSIYCPSPYPDRLEAGITDEIKQKRADAIFTFFPGSTTQMTMKINGRRQGYIYPEVAPPAGFSIPDNVILTKQ